MSTKKGVHAPPNEPEKLTRRQFLKKAGFVVGGAAMSYLAVASACSTPEAAQSTGNSTTPPTTAAPTYPTGTLPTQPGATSQTTSSIATPVGDVYTTPVERPPLSLTPNCTTYVAFDRLYSIEHTWVKQLSQNRAVLGISDKLQALMNTVTRIVLAKVGENISEGTSFGTSEGYKMTVDIITPVSIKILQLNHDVLAFPNLLNIDPFVKGWIMYVELTKPEEVKGLLSPEEYMALQAKDAANEH